jgi:hypothetical protein
MILKRLGMHGHIRVSYLHSVLDREVWLLNLLSRIPG